MRSFVAVAALLLAAPAAGAQTVTVEQPWARATAPQAQAGAVYATLTAATADRLTGASTPVAASVQVHENIHDNGVVRMRELEGGLPLEPGKPVTLAPGGYHLMLIGLKQQLKPGDSFPLTLSFANEPPVTVTVPVAAAGAAAAVPMDHMHMH
jgi:copper(I)-binding protein